MYHMLYNSLQVGSFTADRLVVDLSESAGGRRHLIRHAPPHRLTAHPATANAVVIHTKKGKRAITNHYNFHAQNKLICLPIEKY